MRLSGSKPQGMQQKRSRVSNTRRKQGVDLRMRTKHLGAKEKARRRKNCMRIGARKLLRMGMVVARAWRGQTVGIPHAESVEVEEADGSSSRQERVSLALAFFNNLEFEEELLTIAALCWAEGVWLGNGKKIFELQTWRQVRGACRSNHVRSGHSGTLCYLRSR